MDCIDFLGFFFVLHFCIHGHKIRLSWFPLICCTNFSIDHCKISKIYLSTTTEFIFLSRVSLVHSTVSFLSTWSLVHHYYMLKIDRKTTTKFIMSKCKCTHFTFGDLIRSNLLFVSNKLHATSGFTPKRHNKKVEWGIVKWKIGNFKLYLYTFVQISWTWS